MAPRDPVGAVWESRQAFIQPPWQMAPEVIISEREDAIRCHDKIVGQQEHLLQLVLYTDGSGYQGDVGAAAVCPSRMVTQTHYLGSENTATVYGAELMGMSLAMQIVREHYTEWPEISRGVTVFSDSQAAIKALCRPRAVSGQSMLATVLKGIEWCRQQGIRVAVHWIPAHEGVPGNEAADKAAKEAAIGGMAGMMRDVRMERRLRRERRGEQHDDGLNEQRRMLMAAAAKRVVRSHMRERWEKQWKRARVGEPTKRLMDIPNKKVLKYWKGLRKASSSVMIQLRTGRISLNQYLTRINVRDDAECECGLSNQTPLHVVLECPRFVSQRRDMWQQMDQMRTSDFKALLTDPRAAPAIAHFMIKTGLLTQFQYVDPGATGTSIPNDDPGKTA